MKSFWFRLNWFAKRNAEKLLLRFVWKLPKKIVYWSAIRVMTYKFCGNPAERTCIDALKGFPCQ